MSEYKSSEELLSVAEAAFGWSCNDVNSAIAIELQSFVQKLPPVFKADELSTTDKLALYVLYQHKTSSTSESSSTTVKRGVEAFEEFLSQTGWVKGFKEHEWKRQVKCLGRGNEVYLSLRDEHKYFSMYADEDSINANVLDMTVPEFKKWLSDKIMSKLYSREYREERYMNITKNSLVFDITTESRLTKEELINGITVSYDVDGETGVINTKAMKDNFTTTATGQFVDAELEDLERMLQVTRDQALQKMYFNIELRDELSNRKFLQMAANIYCTTITYDGGRKNKVAVTLQDDKTFCSVQNENMQAMHVSVPKSIKEKGGKEVVSYLLKLINKIYDEEYVGKNFKINNWKQVTGSTNTWYNSYVYPGRYRFDFQCNLDDAVLRAVVTQVSTGKQDKFTKDLKEDCGLYANVTEMVHDYMIEYEKSHPIK